MKYKYSFLMFFAATFLQGNLANIITVFGITPNLILCLVVMFSFLYSDEFHGIIWGTIFGLVSDILYMEYVGISALGYFVLALLVILGSRIFNRENVVTAIMISAAATVFFNVYSFILTSFMGSEIHVLQMIKQLPMMMICNAAVSTIIYQIFIRKVVRFRSDRYYR